ncbi:histidine kinase [Flavobacterium album]|uniref:Histidine kinase n=1 Tax=Flavobacterium album TaxID=2175091 RepID=A0A2S1R2P2_9FLAO|nr:histidine kinase [Flavobacterium album]AWH86887.1 histidine kinase [Flavobacterium album]
MRQKIPFHYHILLFVAVFLFFTGWDMGSKADRMTDELSMSSLIFGFTHIFTIFLIYLLNYYFVCPYLLNRKRILLYALSVPASLLLFAGLRYLIEEVVVYSIIGMHNYAPESLQPGYYIRDNFYFGLPSILLSVIVYLSWQAHVYRMKNQLLEIENRHAQFALLKSQVSPHFLFNTLNSFYSEWVEKDEETAADLLVLSDLLRYIITESDKEQVPLEKELQFIDGYIRLQKKRFENQMYLTYSVEGDAGNQTILPAVVIHFIENVFKHGIINDNEKQALIHITISGGSLEIRTRNHIQQGENYSSTGIGFKNLSDRLGYAYGENFKLDKTTENDIFTTYLKIPLKQS